MLTLMAMIKDAGYDSNLGHAVAMAAAYFNKNTPLKLKKNYTLQEVRELITFLFDVRTKELNLETQAALRVIAEAEAEMREEEA